MEEVAEHVIVDLVVTAAIAAPIVVPVLELVEHCGPVGELHALEACSNAKQRRIELDPRLDGEYIPADNVASLAEDEEDDIAAIADGAHRQPKCTVGRSKLTWCAAEDVACEPGPDLLDLNLIEL